MMAFGGKELVGRSLKVAKRITEEMLGIKAENEGIGYIG